MSAERYYVLSQSTETEGAGQGALELKALQSGVLKEWYVREPWEPDKPTMGKPRGARGSMAGDSRVQKGSRLFSLRSEGEGGSDVVSICNASFAGEMLQKIVAEGDKVEVGTVICRIRLCLHPAVHCGMCVLCGERIKSTPQEGRTALSLTGGHQLMVSQSEALKVQETKVSDLKSIRKLALILDLDHTLVHATEVLGPPPPASVLEQQEGVWVLALEDKEDPAVQQAAAAAKASGAKSVPLKHHLLAARPHLSAFLAEAHKICQMTIYTAGTRRYAEAVARLIDPSGRLFSGRMVSRSDVPNDKSGGLDKSLERLFLGDASMAVVIDDREDVWKGKQADQLLLVKPFHHFRGGRDINNASGATSFNGAVQEAGDAFIALSGSNPGARLSVDEAGRPPKDDQLVRCLEVLRQLHSLYFDTPNPGSVAGLLTGLKSDLLKGCVVTFSGVIPVNEREPSSHPMWRLAVSLGAQVSPQVISRTTHLLAEQKNTAKVHQCLQRGDVWVVHPDWLFYCRWSLSKACEQTFMIAPEASAELPQPVLDPKPLQDDVAAGKRRFDGDGDEAGPGAPHGQGQDASGNGQKRRVKRVTFEDEHVIVATSNVTVDCVGEPSGKGDDDSDDGFGDDFDAFIQNG